MKRIWLILALLPLLLPTMLHAKTAKELAADCAVDTTGMYGDAKSLESNPAANELLKSPDKLLKVTGCLDYIRGVIDTWLIWGVLMEKTQMELTANYSTVDLKDAFMAYLKEHPETTPHPASFVVFAACKEHNMIRFVPKTNEEISAAPAKPAR